jgi:hypothetical protein
MAALEEAKSQNTQLITTCSHLAQQVPSFSQTRDQGVGFGFQVQGLGFGFGLWVSGSGFRIRVWASGIRFRVQD